MIKRVFAATLLSISLLLGAAGTAAAVESPGGVTTEGCIKAKGLPLLESGVCAFKDGSFLPLI